MRLLSVGIVVAFSLVSPLGAEARSGIEGTVTETACGTPCNPPPPTCPPCTQKPCPLAAYPCAVESRRAAISGSMTVTVTRISSGRNVAVLHPADGNFRVRARPGRYHVTASDSTPCVSSAAADVRVRRGHFAHVSLQLQNVCAV